MNPWLPHRGGTKGDLFTDPSQANCSKAFTGGYKLPEDDGNESDFQNKVKSKEAVSTCESLKSSGMEIDVMGRVCPTGIFCMTIQSCLKGLSLETRRSVPLTMTWSVLQISRVSVICDHHQLVSWGIFVKCVCVRGCLWRPGSLKLKLQASVSCRSGWLAFICGPHDGATISLNYWAIISRASGQFWGSA